LLMRSRMLAILPPAQIGVKGAWSAREGEILSAR
jgi:hypothetical protein